MTRGVTLEQYRTYYGQVRIATALDFLLGLLVLISPFFFGYANDPMAFWSQVPTGIVVALIALFRFIIPSRFDWLSLVVAVLGLWLVLSPFFLTYGFEVVGTGIAVYAGAMIGWIGCWASIATRWSHPVPLTDWQD